MAFKTGRGCDEAGIIGSWEGTVSESLGGYRQQIVFEEGGRALVTVGPQSLGFGVPYFNAFLRLLT